MRVLNIYVLVLPNKKKREIKAPNLQSAIAKVKKMYSTETLWKSWIPRKPEAMRSFEVRRPL